MVYPKENYFTVLVVVKNIGKELQDINTVTFVFRDVKGKEMTKLTGYVGVTLQPNEERRISSSVDQDIRTAKDIEYKINRGTK